MENQNKIEVTKMDGKIRTLTAWNINDNGVLWGRDEKGDKYGIPLSNIAEIEVLDIAEIEVLEDGQK